MYQRSGVLSVCAAAAALISELIFGVICPSVNQICNGELFIDLCEVSLRVSAESSPSPCGSISRIIVLLQRHADLCAVSLALYGIRERRVSYFSRLKEREEGKLI